MDKAALQQYCLQAMGITQWKERTALAPQSFPYLLGVEHTEVGLTLEKQQLIERLLQALRWPMEQVFTYLIPIDHFPEAFYQKIAELQSEKVILFGCALAKRLNLDQNAAVIELTKPHLFSVAIVSSLDELLQDKEAKRRTWQMLQPFVLI